MPTVCNEGPQVQCEFQQKGPGRIVVDFDGGQITSDGGAVLLSELASQTSIIGDTAACFNDYRDPNRTSHSLQQLLRQRLLAIACGYEDVTDHDKLRADHDVGASGRQR